MTDDLPGLPEGVDPDKPVINVTPATVTCSSHGEYFRKDFPKGWLLFSVPLMHDAMMSSGVTAALAKYEGGTPEDALTALFKARPMCMFVPPARVRELYTDSGILVPGICGMCSAPGPGGTIKIGYVGRERTIDHVCVDCVMRMGEREHAHRGGPPV